MQEHKCLWFSPTDYPTISHLLTSCGISSCPSCLGTAVRYFPHQDEAEIRINRHMKHAGPRAQWPTFIMLLFCLQGPNKPPLLVTNMSYHCPLLIKLSCGHHLRQIFWFPKSQVSKSLYLLKGVKWCHTFIVSFSDLWRPCQTFLLTFYSPFCYCAVSRPALNSCSAWICLSTAPETSGSVVVSAP